MSAQRYLSAAFNARPLGMPIPPNWLGLAAFGLLGTLLNPGFLLIGAGLEVAYLTFLANNRRFRAVVDLKYNPPPQPDPWPARRAALIRQIPPEERRRQTAMEEQCAAVAQELTRVDPSGLQAGQLAQLCWLHLKLLAARGALEAVVQVGERERENIQDKLAELERRLAVDDIDPQLRDSLEDQQRLINERQRTHSDAGRRLAIVDAELERIRQQLALVHEQTLLSTDASSLARSVDVLSASLGETNRWIKDQGEIFAAIDDFTDQPPIATFMQPVPSASAGRRSLGEKA